MLPRSSLRIRANSPSFVSRSSWSLFEEALECLSSLNEVIASLQHLAASPQFLLLSCSTACRTSRTAWSTLVLPITKTRLAAGLQHLNLFGFISLLCPPRRVVQSLTSFLMQQYLSSLMMSPATVCVRISSKNSARSASARVHQGPLHEPLNRTGVRGSARRGTTWN